MPTDPPTRPNNYFIDAESAEETARLMHQDRLITKGMEGVFSERSDISSMHHIVDLACGPGGWVLDVAFAYPGVEVMGVDISETTIRYAHAQAKVQGLNNADFRQMDITKPLDLPDSFYDLVNARFLGFLPKAAWPKLVKECLRITRPGGTIRLTESEWGFTNSPAYEQLYTFFANAMKAAGQRFSPERPFLGITPMLGGFLHDIGCVNIQHKAHAIDFSVGTEQYEAFRQNWIVAFKLLEPFCIKMGVTTEEKFDQLYQQLQLEMLLDDFRGIMFLLTVWGEKPED
ncbi:MAG: class I SAM-dependent methyltransferase [Ktedonobacteraceae bacterium]